MLGAAVRQSRAHEKPLPVWYPAASVGDLGAAAGPLLLVVAATGIARGYAPGPVVMCEASSDDGLRAACVVMLDDLLPMNRKAKLWDLFLERHAAISGDAREDFNAAFGKAFRRAYEAQVKQLRGDRS